MGKSKKNRDKDKRSYAYYDDAPRPSSAKKGNKKSKDRPHNNKEFVDWDAIR